MQMNHTQESGMPTFGKGPFQHRTLLPIRRMSSQNKGKERAANMTIDRVSRPMVDRYHLVT